MADDNNIQALLACYDNVTTPPAANFDYVNQYFMLEDPIAGIVVARTGDIETLQTTLVSMAAIFASQLGAALTIAVVMLLMTVPEKRKSLSFVFNTLALLCDVVRCICQIAQLNSAMSNYTIIALELFSAPGMRQATAVGVTGIVLTLLLFVFIELALITQVRVVCAAATQTQQRMITIFTAVVGMLAIGFRCYLTAINIHSIIHLGDISEDSQTTISKAQNMSNVSGIISICVFSAIFCFKLFMAIKSRRSMGLKQFGPMQIIFIMGCQTLILPAIFAILAYYAIKDVQLQSVVETIVAVFLPLSSIWASANTTAKLKANNHVAIMALPEYKPIEKNVAGRHSLGSDTMIDLARETDADLRSDERFFRSKYDIELLESATSIDKHGSVDIQTAEKHDEV